jgi:hypothetical protein
MKGAKKSKEGLLYHKAFVFEGEHTTEYVPHGPGVCLFATGEALVGTMA